MSGQSSEIELENFEDEFEAGPNLLEDISPTDKNKSQITVDRDYLAQYLTEAEGVLANRNLPIPAGGLMPTYAFEQTSGKYSNALVIGRQDRDYPGLWMVVPPGKWSRVR